MSAGVSTISEESNGGGFVTNGITDKQRKSMTSVVFDHISTPNQVVDLLPIVGAAVRHGQQNALDFQLGVDLPSNLLHGLQKLFQTLCR